MMDVEHQIDKLKRDLANYKELLAVRTRDYAHAANLVLACQDMIQETEEAIHWLEAGGWDAARTDQ